MSDSIILEKSSQISYTREELSKMADTSNHLRGIIRNQIDFSESFLGGSYKRATMVKGISDVDVYYEYIGTGNSQTALLKLKNCLTNSYPNSVIKQDSPSILVDFDRIPFNITPYKKSSINIISIPDNSLIGWSQINFGELETAIQALRQKNSQLIDLIKILKLWNFNYSKGLKNFAIEKDVCNLFLYPFLSSSSITDWLWSYFNNCGYRIEANKMHELMCIKDDRIFKTEWLKFIDKK